MYAIVETRVKAKAVDNLLVKKFFRSPRAMADPAPSYRDPTAPAFFIFIPLKLSTFFELIFKFFFFWIFN